MRVKFLNRDKTISAPSNDDIVTWMRSNDLERYRSNADFIKAYAERKKLFEDISLSTEDADSFVKDLEQNKIIEFIKNRLSISFRRTKQNL